MHTRIVAFEAARGLLVGGGLSLAWVILCRSIGRETWGDAWTDRWGLIWPLFGTIVGLLSGLARPVRWLEAARGVDRRYRLQDATATAWQLAELRRDEPLVQLQIERATERLRQALPSDLVRWKIPRSAAWGCVLWLLAVGISLAPKNTDSALATQDAADRPDPSRQAAVAKQIEQTVLADVAKLAQQSGLPTPEVRRLKSLQHEFEKGIRRIRDPQQSSRGTLRELSKMQSKLAEAQAAVQSQSKERTLSKIAQTMSSAEELQAIAEALEKKEYQQAAEQLSQSDPRPADPQVREQVQQELSDATEKVRESGDTQMADAMDSLQNAMDQTDAAQAQQLTQPLGQVLQDEALRLSVQQQLAVQLAALSEAKAMAQDGGKNTAKSDQSRETWGQGDAGDPLTGESQLPEGTERKQEQLEGVAGEGPSERRRVERPVEEAEATQVPTRDAQRLFQQSVEESLRTESLPLSHRQTIREYFRTIRKESGVRRAGEERSEEKGVRRD